MNFISATDDWLQEEYEKIKKNQSLQTLQSKLDSIKKQNEILTEMRNRVSKYKSNANNKTLEFYKPENRKEDTKDNILEEGNSPEAEGDKDLLLEEFEEKTDCDSDDEISEENKDERIKVSVSVAV